MSVREKSLPLNSKGSPASLCESISKTITEIERRWMSAFAISAIGLSRDMNLDRGHRFDVQAELPEQLIEVITRIRIKATLDNNARF